MTRKRTRESLERVLSSECTHCNGWGRVLSRESTVYDMVRDIERYYLRTGFKDIRIRIRDDIQDMLLNEEKALYHSLLEKYDIELQLLPAALHSSHLKEAPYEVLNI
jgi:ribonuclease G